MTKADLIAIILEKANITRIKAEMVVETVFESMKETLKKGDRIEVRGFGTFELRHYDAYQGRNPKTGDIIEVTEKLLPFFRAGKELRARVDGKAQTSF
jgi:integration host factor subunit beta